MPSSRSSDSRRLLEPASSIQLPEPPDLAEAAAVTPRRDESPDAFLGQSGQQTPLAKGWKSRLQKFEHPLQCAFGGSRSDSPPQLGALPPMPKTALAAAPKSRLSGTGKRLWSRVQKDIAEEMSLWLDP